MTDRVERILRRARNIIRTRGWTQGYYAADADGGHVNHLSDRAKCFCAVGAMKLARHELYSEEVAREPLTLEVDRVGPAWSHAYHDAYNVMLAAIKATVFAPQKYVGVSTWNDKVERRKQHVLDMFGLAADQARFENRPALKGAQS